MTGNCLCGAVSVTIEAKPEFINDRNCSQGRKVGGAWGYFLSPSVKTHSQTSSVTRRDMGSPCVEVHSCAICATTTHWVLTKAFKEQNPSADQMGVNMRLFDPGELEGVQVHFPNGQDWDGEGPYGYRRPAMTIGAGTSW